MRNHQPIPLDLRDQRGGISVLDYDAGAEPHRIIGDMIGDPCASGFGVWREEINGGIWNVGEEAEVGFI